MTENNNQNKLFVNLSDETLKKIFNELSIDILKIRTENEEFFEKLKDEKLKEKIKDSQELKGINLIINEINLINNLIQIKVKRNKNFIENDKNNLGDKILEEEIIVLGKLLLNAENYLNKEMKNIF